MTDPTLQDRLVVRRAEHRGQADHGWLRSAHTFSFGSYHNPSMTGFRTLRVINEDYVAPGKGFGTHPHRDMEIISYVVDGALRHIDGMGHESTLRAGQFQRMSAGRGIEHSEANASDERPVHFYQIWIQPASQGIEPSYEEYLPADDGPLVLVASRGGRAGSMTIHQDADIWLGRMQAGTTTSVDIARDRGVWIQSVRNVVHIDGQSLEAGDSASLEGPATFTIAAESDGAEFLLFDLA